MKRFVLTVAGCALLLLLAGCKEDHRNTQEKLYSPASDYATRYVMACPKCGAPTKPFRINVLKSYYKCNGLPPKFVYHEEVQWSHRIKDKDPQVEQ
jgi:hypothetical protein